MNDNEYLNGLTPDGENSEPTVQDDAESIADKYVPDDSAVQSTESGNAEQAEEIPVVESEPVTPVTDNGQQTYNSFNNGTYNSGSYNPQFTQPQPPVAKAKKKTGRKVFCILLAIAVIACAIIIPVSLNKHSDDKPLSDNGTTVNADAPKIEIEKTPVSNKKGDTITSTEIHDKIAKINAAIMVYKDNSLYTEGTGIFMKEDDGGNYTYILTCAHVISEAGVTITVQLEDGTRYDAEIVGFDERTDIGVLRVKATGFECAEFGDSDSLKVGDPVYAIGNPGGSALFGTFTNGMVSAIGRNITSSIGYDMVCIQHNAAISPGNSGGALVNQYGQVIGINSSKIAATDYEGISFAIPITQAQDVINKVIAHGYVPGRPKLGISYVANDSSGISSIYSMAVQMKGLPSGSLVIYSIDEKSALSGTQAQAGDMITAVNGKKLDKADVLLEEIENSKVGDKLKLKLFRITLVNGKYQTSELEVEATLIEETNEKTEEQTTQGVYGNNYSGDLENYFGGNFGDFFGF